MRNLEQLKALIHPYEICDAAVAYRNVRDINGNWRSSYRVDARTIQATVTYDEGTVLIAAGAFDDRDPFQPSPE